MKRALAVLSRPAKPFWRILAVDTGAVIDCAESLARRVGAEMRSYIATA